MRQPIPKYGITGHRQNQDTDVPALYDGAWVEDQHLVNKYYFRKFLRHLPPDGSKMLHLYG